MMMFHKQYSCAGFCDSSSSAPNALRVLPETQQRLAAGVSLTVAAMKAAVAMAALATDASAVVAIVRHSAFRSRKAWVGSLSDEKSFGDPKCPCIGFDNIDGETLVAFGNSTTGNGTLVEYPADLGARCEAWDDDRHPDCKEGGWPGEGSGFCAQRWCYVDSCNCDLPVPAKVSTYVPDASYRGKPVFFSYATCGGKDLWTEEVPEVGMPGCRCIGFDNIPGTIDIKLQGRDGSISVASYPAEIGGTCKAHGRAGPWEGRIMGGQAMQHLTTCQNFKLTQMAAPLGLCCEKHAPVIAIAKDEYSPHIQDTRLREDLDLGQVGQDLLVPVGCA